MTLFDPTFLLDARDRATERAAAADDALPAPPSDAMLGELTPYEWARYDAAMRLLDRRAYAEARLTPPAIDAHAETPEQPRDHATATAA